MSFLFVNKTLRLNNWKTRTTVSAKTSVFVICAEAIIYLLLHNLHGCSLKATHEMTVCVMNDYIYFAPILCQGKIFVGCNSFCRCLSLVFKIGFCWLLLFHYFPFSYRLDPLKAAYLKIFVKFQDTIFVKWKDFKLFGF